MIRRHLVPPGHILLPKVEHNARPIPNLWTTSGVDSGFSCEPIVTVVCLQWDLTVSPLAASERQSELGAVPQGEFAEGRGDVILHGAFAEVELLSDLSVRRASRN